MKHLFTIREMSKLFGINMRTLRYYDSIGILKPEYTDRQTGYRYYSAKQFEQLNNIPGICGRCICRWRRYPRC